MSTQQELIDQGYRCRSGHTTGDWADFGWSHDCIGEEYTFVIVKNDFPEISHISTGCLDVIYFTNGQQVEVYDFEINEQGDWVEKSNIIGYGETEEEAWQSVQD